MNQADVLARLRSHVAVRALHVEAVEAARQAETAASSDVLVAGSRFAKALTAYEREPDEGRRLALRSAADAIPATQATLTERRAAADAAIADLRKLDEQLVRGARDVHDPARILAASTIVALALLPVEAAQRAASGDVDVDELRQFVARVEEHHQASAYLRAAGVPCVDVAWSVFLLPLFEALVDHGRAVGNIWNADSLPPKTPAALKSWLEKAAEAPASPPGSVANARAMLAQARACCEAGCRTAHQVEAMQRDRTGSRPLRGEVPPMHHRNLSGPDSEHYPAGVAIDAPRITRAASAVAEFASGLVERVRGPGIELDPSETHGPPRGRGR